MNLIEQYNTHNEYGKYLGMEFKVIEPGLVNYFLTITSNHLATPQAAHGGVIASLMDGLLGVTALSATQHHQQIVSTVEFKINFLNAAFEGDVLKGIGKVEQQGKRLLVVSGDIICEKRNCIIAKAIGTFNAYPAEKAGYQISQD